MHGSSIIIGFLILYQYVPESLYLLTTFTVSSYIYLQLPKKYRCGIGTFIPSIFIISYWYIILVYQKLFCQIEFINSQDMYI